MLQRLTARSVLFTYNYMACLLFVFSEILLLLFKMWIIMEVLLHFANFGDKFKCRFDALRASFIWFCSNNSMLISQTST